VPAFVAAQHIDLHEGTGIMFLLPRRGLFARAQPHHDIADPHRLAGFQHDIARRAVTLVEQPQRRDPLGHRRCAIARIDAAAAIDRHDVACAGIGIERGDRRLLRLR